MMTVIERAIAYVRNMPGGMAGSGGHPATFEVACVLVKGFSLPEDVALEIMHEVHNPLCSPPWSPKELRHKVQSAARDSKRESGYLLHDDEKRSRERAEKTQSTERLDPIGYHNVVTKLRELCGDFTELPDALGYLDRRGLIVDAAHAGVFALPPRSAQKAIVTALCDQFEAESLVRAGLLWKGRDGKVEFRNLAFAEHRLCIPWCMKDGCVNVLQRRRVGSGDRPYVFPSGMRPMFPFGSERLGIIGPGTAIAYCEGAFDTLALRRIVRRDKLDVLPLGLPGVDGWRFDWARFATGRRALIALDADHAGDEAAEKLAIDLVAHRAASVERWRPPAKDWAATIPGVAA